MKDVEKLPLVFMEPLYLDIKDGIGAYLDAVVFGDIFHKAYLVLVLDVQKFLLALWIIRKRQKLLHLRKIRDPAVADL